MAVGKLVRRVLGPKLFRPVGEAYRALFVDLNEVGRSYPELAPGAHVLDVGGGDGQLVNVLLRRFPDTQVTMIDIGAQLGTALDETARARVRVLPSTSIRDYLQKERQRVDLVTVCDVIHHVPGAQRVQFVRDLAELLEPETDLFIKDVRPGGIRSWAACMADRYITGDRHVSFAHEHEVEQLVREVLPQRRAERSHLYDRDAPNYSLLFRGQPRIAT